MVVVSFQLGLILSRSEKKTFLGKPFASNFSLKTIRMPKTIPENHTHNFPWNFSENHTAY